MKTNIYRDKNGIPHIYANSLVEVYWGLGYVHAQDRGMQMLLMRILGKGRLSEQLDSSESSLEIDKFFRKTNWHNNIDDQLNKLTDFERSIMEAYCEGANSAFEISIPWELKLLGYKHEQWLSKDTIILTRMIAYLTLSQSQEEVERLLIEMIKNKVPKEMLEELFPNLLEGLDIDLIQKVVLQKYIIPSELWNIAIPRMMSSNNWVISSWKSVSNKPILANDPHLEINRIPNVWCEVSAVLKDKYILGASIPGIPAFLIGRNPNIAWGVTYAFADSVDSWIEDCKDGFYKKNDEWRKFHIRTEIIKRKNKQDYEAIFFENEHGVLDGNPNIEGYYLSTKWAATESGIRSFKNFLKMWDAKTVEEGMDYLGQVESYWNWVLADDQDNIGYQMSGLIPKREEGLKGFIPLPGWIEKNDWQGFESHLELPRVLNPPKGYFATANNDLNQYGKCKPITMPMGSYRADRISQRLSEREIFSEEDMFQIQSDLYSIQAEKFMEIIRPLLPKSEQGIILNNWNCEYTEDSKGAYLFEKFYSGLLKQVFGTNVMGENVIDFFASEIGVFIDFYQNFDRILLSEKSLWFNGKTREEIYKSVLEKTITVPVKTWGEGRKLFMVNILFNEKLPKFFGFDIGPIPIKGGRATINQGQIYKSSNRVTTFAPSYRFVTDLSKHEIHTNLVGGPTDRRFSIWYSHDLDNWLNGKYKKIEPNPKKKLAF